MPARRAIALLVFVVATARAQGGGPASDAAKNLTPEQQAELEDRIRTARTIRLTSTEKQVELIESPVFVSGAIGGWVADRDLTGRVRRRVSYQFTDIDALEIESPRPRIVRGLILGTALGLVSGVLLAERIRSENTRITNQPPSTRTKVGVIAGFTIAFGAAGAAAGATRKEWEKIYGRR